MCICVFTYIYIYTYIFIFFEGKSFVSINFQIRTDKHFFDKYFEDFQGTILTKICKICSYIKKNKCLHVLLLFLYKLYDYIRKRYIVGISVILNTTYSYYFHKIEF